VHDVNGVRSWFSGFDGPIDYSIWSTSSHGRWGIAPIEHVFDSAAHSVRTYVRGE